MAFESLSDKLQKIMKKVKGQAKLTESNMDEMLREIIKLLKSLLAMLKKKLLVKKF